LCLKIVWFDEIKELVKAKYLLSPSFFYQRKKKFSVEAQEFPLQKALRV